jgi:hypothetical protein
MKKTKYLLLTLVLFVGVIFLTGCTGGTEKEKEKEKKEEEKGIEIKYTHGKGIVSLRVPKGEDGKAKYEFTTEKPQGISVSKTFYLVTDNAMLGFATTGLSYNTSQKYKDKYGDKKASFDGYLEFIEDKDLFNKSYLPGLEQFEINGRKALRYYNRAGGSGDYNYYGYFYFIGVDDIYTGSKFDVVVNYKDEEKPKEAKEFDKETLDIIKSIKITAAETK